MERERLEKSISELSGRLDVHALTPSADDVDHALNLLDQVDTYLKHSVCVSDSKDPEQKIVFLGTTGAGKSTVITFLYGEDDMVVHHRSPYTRELVAKTTLPGVNIRGGSTSSTLLPVVNRVRLGDKTVAVWDMPGSRDTRGSFVELLVHFIYNWLLKDDKDLRFVIVSPPPLERPQQVTLERLINGSLIRAENAVVVYTKCGVDFDPKSTSDLDIKDSKQGIRSFTLPAPVKTDKEGHNYSRQYHEKKRELVEALVKLRSFAVTFEQHLPDAALYLLNVLSECSIGFAREVLSKCFLSVYDWKDYTGTLEEIESALVALRQPNAVSFDNVIDSLLHLVPHHGDRVRNDPEIIRAGHRLTLVETIAGTDNSRHLVEWLNADCIGVIEDAKEKLLKLRNDVLAYRIIKCDNILIVSSVHLRLSSELPQILKFVEKHEAAVTSVDTIPTIILIGFSSLEFDVNQHMWANVTLVSPSIEVNIENDFDLSATCQAKSGQKENVVAGKDGEDGKPGLPGGNLLVVCNQLEGNVDFLLGTSCRGQNGGDGGNGGNGVDGADSAYYLNDFKSAVDEAVESGKLYSNSGILTDGWLVSYTNYISPLSGWFYSPQAIKLWSVTKTSEPGEACIRPGSGGFGGAGGKSGSIRIQIYGDVWEINSGVCGIKGSEGEDGKPSRDGHPSPSFSATVHQWYFEGGKEAKREFKAKVDELFDYPPMIHADKKKVAKAPALSNSSLDLVFVQETYESLRVKLQTEFSHCDFSNLNIQWET